MPKIELLSPAGSFEALKAAVNYGADAVYLGGTNFSARAFANNFNHEELIEAVNYCHLRGVKVYVTLNTLLSEYELKNALDEADFYYRNKVDALIIQDLGLFYCLKEKYPDFNLHASTQMHIHNINGVKNAAKLGFKKVVLARESSLELIKEACKEDIEIECFIHGAICVSYSGQCLMSSAVKNRSANKGMCAQLCRLKYHLYDFTVQKEIETKTPYLLSPKDMYLLEDIPLLIEAGVSSLKIEGRLKSPAYVGLVTKIYREAIDAYYEEKEFKLNNEEFNNLLKVFNRGFTNSYLNNNDLNIFNNKRPNHMGEEVGEVISCYKDKCFIKLNKPINQFDGIRILNKDEDFGKILNTLSINNKYVSRANAGDIIEIKIDQKVNKGDVVVRTLDHNLEKEIENYKLKENPIDLNIELKLNEPIKIKARVFGLNYSVQYQIKTEIAKKVPINKDDLLSIFSKNNKSPFFIDGFKAEIDNLFIVRSEINEIRRQFYKDLEDFILNSFKRESTNKLMLNDLSEDNNNEILIENNSNYSINGKLLIKDPVINQEGIYNRKQVVSEFGNLLSDDKNKIAYYTLNVCNSYAYELLNRLGFKSIILSSELTKDQISALTNAYNARNKANIRPYCLIFGRRALMYLKGNPFKEYLINGHKYLLNDGNNQYLLRFNENFNEIVEYEPTIRKELINEDVSPFIMIENGDIEMLKKELNIVL